MKKDLKQGKDTKEKTFAAIKDILPSNLMGKHREPVVVRRPNQFAPKITHTFNDSEILIQKDFEELKDFGDVNTPRANEPSFQEQNYDYISCLSKDPMLWKPANHFFRFLLGDNKKTYESFIKWADDLPNMCNFNFKRFNWIDDTTVSYSNSSQTTSNDDIRVCDYVEREETEEAYALRIAELDKSKPKNGKKIVYVI